RTAREGGARDQGLRSDDRVAERRRALGAPHPRRVRRKPPAVADRSHRPVPDAPHRPRRALGRGLAGDESLLHQGKVVYVGSSNFAGWNIAQANETAKARHFLGLVCEQSLYNLASRTIELEVHPACRMYGLGVIPWSPLAGGMLGGMVTTGDTARRKSVQPRYERIRPQLERWEKFCAELGEEPAAVALAWLLHQRGVTGPIIGPRTLEQLEGASLRAVDLTLDAATLATLDEIFPGPGGRAPEAYAW